jgi:dTDP-4-dehydrorhamnose 3,5-epimerase
MKIEIVKSPLFIDDRGMFFPLPLDGHRWVQSNISVSKKYTFRGLHHQTGKTAQSKQINVLRGSVLDIIVDLQPESFRDVQFFRLLPGDQITVPAYCAHGFLALEDDTIIQYLVDNEYSPKTDVSFSWKSVEVVKELVLAEIGYEDSISLSAKDAVGIQLTKEFIVQRNNKKP